MDLKGIMLNKKKANSKGYMLHDSNNINSWDDKIIELENRLVIATQGQEEAQERCEIIKNNMINSCWMELFCFLTIVIYTHPYMCDNIA